MLVVAWFAGFGPAVVALGLGVAAINYFFAPPLYELGFTWRDSAWVFPLVIVGLVVARLAATRRRIEDERAASLAGEQAARMDAEQAADRLRDVQGIVDTALTHAEFEDFLRAILKRVRRSLPSDTATVLLLRDDRCHLTPMASDGLREELGEEIRIPLGRGAAGRIAASETGLVFEDLATVDVVSPFLRSRVRSLESSGHEVHQAEDGQTAVRVAERVRPEIVVDIGVPLLDGWEVAREIRTRLPHLETVLVAFTGYARPEDHRRSREAGFDRHLVKPVDPARLAEVMRLGSSRSAAD